MGAPSPRAINRSSRGIREGRENKFVLAKWKNPKGEIFLLILFLGSEGPSTYDIRKLLWFFEPLPPCVHFHTTSLTSSAFWYAHLLLESAPQRKKKCKYQLVIDLKCVCLPDRLRCVKLVDRESLELAITQLLSCKTHLSWNWIQVVTHPIPYQPNPQLCFLSECT